MGTMEEKVEITVAFRAFGFGPGGLKAQTYDPFRAILTLPRYPHVEPIYTVPLTHQEP